MAFFVLCSGFYACNNTDKTTAVSKADVLASNMDSTVSPGADFFDYANGGWVKKNPIPGEQSSWGIGNLVIEENLKRLREISEKAAASNAAKGSGDQKIGDFWTTAMDSVKIEADGLKPIQSLLSTRDSAIALDESLFRHDLTLYQNKMESLRNVWEAISSFDDDSEDFSCRSFSAEGFQKKAEFPLIKDIEVNGSNTSIACTQTRLMQFRSKF